MQAPIRANDRSTRDPSKVLLIRTWKCSVKNRLLLVIMGSYGWLQVVGRAERRCSFALPKDRFPAGAHRGIIPSFFVTQRHRAPFFSQSHGPSFLRSGAQYRVCDDDDGVRFRGVTDLSRGNPSCEKRTADPFDSFFFVWRRLVD